MDATGGVGSAHTAAASAGPTAVAEDLVPSSLGAGGREGRLEPDSPPEWAREAPRQVRLPGDLSGCGGKDRVYRGCPGRSTAARRFRRSPAGASARVPNDKGPDTTAEAEAPGPEKEEM
jgi:hypothetical protein